MRLQRTFPTGHSRCCVSVSMKPSPTRCRRVVRLSACEMVKVTPYGRSAPLATVAVRVSETPTSRLAFLHQEVVEAAQRELVSQARDRTR